MYISIVTTIGGKGENEGEDEREEMSMRTPHEGHRGEERKEKK